MKTPPFAVKEPGKPVISMKETAMSKAKMEEVELEVAKPDQPAEEVKEKKEEVPVQEAEEPAVEETAPEPEAVKEEKSVAVPEEKDAEPEQSAETEPEKKEEDAPAAEPEEKPEQAEAKPSRRRRKHQSEDDSIIEASKKVQRERRSEAGQVFTKDPKGPGTVQTDPIHEEFLELAASQRNKIVRSGVLNAVSTTPDGYAIAKVRYGHFVVLIPATQLFVLSEDGVKDGGVNSSYQYYASRRIGAPIDFIVEQVDEGSKTAVASRLAAMQQLSRHYYVEKHNGAPLISPGQIVEATIVYRMENGIGVEAFGAETFIHNSELSWNRFLDARREDYTVGQRINVKVLEVQNIDYHVGDRAYQLIGLRASAKQATSDPNEENYDAIQVGDISTGIITNVEAKIGYFVVLDAWPRTIVCQFTQGDRIIPIGSKVIVKIARKIDENKWIFGRITDVLKTPDVSYY